MEPILKVLSEKTKILDRYGDQIPPVVDLAKKGKVNSGMVLGGFLFVAALLLLLFSGFTIVMTCYTVIYPGLLSIRAINSKANKDDKTWLTYWLIFGVLNVAETFLGFVFYFIPYWSWLRIGLFVWLLQFNGSRDLYEKFLRNLLLEHKDLI
jgi:receptor expression-enhancing protein 5/6